MTFDEKIRTLKKRLTEISGVTEVVEVADNDEIKQICAALTFAELWKVKRFDLKKKED